LVHLFPGLSYRGVSAPPETLDRMAGGMGKRGGLSLSERVNPAAQDTAPSPATEPEPPSIRHCWVTDRHGRLPGLLLEWQRRADGWHGRVVRPVREDDGWQVVEEWLPAGLLGPDPGRWTRGYAAS